MADPDVDPAPQGTQSAPWFTQQAAGNGGDGLSTTPDDGLMNQQLNRIASDLDSQSGDLVTALDAITAALDAKPAA